MSGSATALVIVSVLFSMVMATSAYLYQSGARAREARSREQKGMMVSALSEMLDTNNVGSTDSLDVYSDVKNVNGKSSDTIDYTYPGGWQNDLERGIIVHHESVHQLPPEDNKISAASSMDTLDKIVSPTMETFEMKRAPTMDTFELFADTFEVIATPTMDTADSSRKGIIKGIEDCKYNTNAVNKSTGRKDESQNPLHPPTKIFNLDNTRRNKIVGFDDISVLSEIASVQLTELIDDVAYIKGMLSQLSNTEEVAETSCSANECLQWFAGVSDNGSTGSLERDGGTNKKPDNVDHGSLDRERKINEEKDNHVASMITFVRKREAKKIDKQDDALAKMDEDKKKRKGGRSPFKKSKKEREMASADKRGSQRKRYDR